MGLESFISGYTIGSGILYIAAATRDAGHEVFIELGNKENIIGLIKRHSPDVVGMTCLTVSYPVTRNMINMIKEHNPSIITIIGGHHATFMTKEIFAECNVDYVLRGEGETAFPSLLKEIESGNRYAIIEGIAFRKENQIVNANSLTLLKDIDSLPKVTIDLVPKEIENFSPGISTSRGCPFRCSFCSISSFYGGKWQARNIENVLDDIEMYAQEGHIKTFRFSDDNFTVNTKRVRKICEGLKERGLDNLKWSCKSRVDSICRDPGMVEKMQEVSCTNMSLGIESGVQEILNTYKKNITLEQIQKAVRIMNNSSIFHAWYMMIGSGDNYDQPKYIEQSIAFMKKIRFDILQISILTPFPGTELYNRLSSEHRLLHKDWNKYDCAHCVYQPSNLSPKQIEDYFIKAYKSLNFDRNPAEILKVAWKGIKSGLVSTTQLLRVTKYYTDVFIRKKDIYKVLE